MKSFFHSKWQQHKVELWTSSHSSAAIQIFPFHQLSFFLSTYLVFGCKRFKRKKACWSTEFWISKLLTPHSELYSWWNGTSFESFEARNSSLAFIVFFPPHIYLFREYTRQRQTRRLFSCLRCLNKQLFRTISQFSIQKHPLQKLSEGEHNIQHHKHRAGLEPEMRKRV